MLPLSREVFVCLLLSLDMEFPEIDHGIDTSEKSEEAPKSNGRINRTKGESEEVRVEVVEEGTGKVPDESGPNHGREHNTGHHDGVNAPINQASSRFIHPSITAQNILASRTYPKGLGWKPSPLIYSGWAVSSLPWLKRSASLTP
jgi:hypothetical protein